MSNLIIYGPFLSRRQAQTRQLAYYFSGSECKHGHIGIRYTSTGQCFTCNSLRNKSEEVKIKRRGKVKYDDRLREYHRQRYRRKNPVPRKVHVSEESRKIAINLRNRINGALSGASKSLSTSDLLGCSYEYFLNYLESKFTEGMTWENKGKTGWHIDHIRPCASFDLTDPSQQKQCFHYSNLQPLWAKDNIRKGAQWTQ